MTEIRVTTVSDASNGDVSSVEKLVANPGPDGISLREGLVATNNDPGTYTIRFAPALAGKTITLGADLPPLTGGGVTIEGAGVTLSTTVTDTFCAAGVGLVLGDGDPHKNRYATANRIVGVAIDANRITIGRANLDGAGDPHNGGIVLLGGGSFGRGGAIRDVRITNNRIATTRTGIKLVGGFSSTARGNTVSCVRLAGNRITGARRAVSVLANVGKGTTGNRATLGGC